MQSSYSSPKLLIEQVQMRRTKAREELARLLSEPLGKLIDRLIEQHKLPHAREVLLDHTIHSAETFLRTRPLTEFDDMSWPAFLATVLLHEAKLTHQPQSTLLDVTSGALALPQSRGYESFSLFLPSEKIGDYWFSGDWIGAGHHNDGSYWILVADVTGHGYSAYLVARSLPDVWEICWANLRGGNPRPVDVLHQMHVMLQDCLPEAVYVEATLAQFCMNGEAVVSPAGGSRLFLLNGMERMPKAYTLRGGWLGLISPDANDEKRWQLDSNDEMLLGTDGLFDQLCDYGNWEDALITLFGQSPISTSLYEYVRLHLEEALTKHPQRDDITMVTIRKLAKYVDDSIHQTG